MSLEDKVALITGGGRGIGKAIAIAYARAGAKLALCARTASELEQSVTELRALKTEAQGWICDVSLEEPVKQFVAGAYEKFGRIDVLVNNAGVMTRPVPMTELDIRKLHDGSQLARAVFSYPSRSTDHDETKERIDHQRFINDRPGCLCQFYCLRDFKMGIGRIQPDACRRGALIEHSGQFSRTRLCRDQAHWF